MITDTLILILFYIVHLIFAISEYYQTQTNCQWAFNNDCVCCHFFTSFQYYMYVCKDHHLLIFTIIINIINFLLINYIYIPESALLEFEFDFLVSAISEVPFNFLLLLLPVSSRTLSII